MARILAVGVATLDIINEVTCYPHEDAELRALAHAVRRGGNATNTLVVLSQLGHACDWAGVLADEPDTAVISSELARYNIQTRYCTNLAEGKLPTSYITLSRETGSRTIVHYRDLPEYDCGAFSGIPLQDFDWIHFEGRNVSETACMMRRVRAQCPEVPVSLEVEKPRADIDRLFPLANLIQVSPAYADYENLSPGQLLARLHQANPAAALVCTLGERGAIGLDAQGGEWRVAAHSPADVIDTLGAGDTFNAGLIDATLRGASLPEAMEFAVVLAGNKCAQAGLHQLNIPGRPDD